MNSFDDRNNRLAEAAHQRIDAIERMLQSKLNNPAPTIPQFDQTNFPQDAVPGQIATDPNDNSMWVYGNDGVWHRVSGGQSWVLYRIAGGIQPASTDIQYLTVDQITTNDSTTFNYGTGVNGQVPQVTAPGIYEITYSYTFSGATVGDRLQGYFSGDIGTVSLFIHGINVITYDAQTPAGDNINNTASFKTLRAVPAYPTGSASVPQSENPTVQNLSSANSFTVVGAVLIKQLYAGSPTSLSFDGVFTW